MANYGDLLKNCVAVAVVALQHFEQRVQSRKLVYELCRVARNEDTVSILSSECRMELALS